MYIQLRNLQKCTFKRPPIFPIMEYINSYQIWTAKPHGECNASNTYVFGFGFRTNKGRELQCGGGDGGCSEHETSGWVTYEGYFMGGVNWRGGNILDAIGFCFVREDLIGAVGLTCDPPPSCEETESHTCQCQTVCGNIGEDPFCKSLQSLTSTSFVYELCLNPAESCCCRLDECTYRPTTTPTAATRIPSASLTLVPSASPTSDSIPPTSQSVSPTLESIPPTSESASPTSLSVSPTSVSIPPTSQSIPPTAESIPPTAVSSPPTKAPVLAPTTTPTINTEHCDWHCYIRNYDDLVGTLDVNNAKQHYIEIGYSEGRNCECVPTKSPSVDPSNQPIRAPTNGPTKAPTATTTVFVVSDEMAHTVDTAAFSGGINESNTESMMVMFVCGGILILLIILFVAIFWVRKHKQRESVPDHDEDDEDGDL